MISSFLCRGALLVILCLYNQRRGLGGAYGGWIDPDTPLKYSHIHSYHHPKEQYDLVFSDEFEINDRDFIDGSDPKWTSIEKNDYTNDALQYYRDQLVKTRNGKLLIQTILKDYHFTAYDDITQKATKLTKNYQSGMVQGWNKFCFTGGIVEISAKLPGKAEIGGLWPAMWLLGNLARATYVQSSDNVWPWSYNQCLRDTQKQQQISKCNLMNHYDFHSFQGRGAPEIDILEAMPGKEILKNTPINRPYYSASLQISPGIEDDRPTLGFNPSHTSKSWYTDGLEYGQNSSVNIYFYGTVLKNEQDEKKDYQTDAISANRAVEDTHFEEFHKYRIEWKTGSSGYIRWSQTLLSSSPLPLSVYLSVVSLCLSLCLSLSLSLSNRYLDSELVFALNSDTLSPNHALIPEEPM
jgi:beta-glucan synthesis-associated protein KRE6